MVPHLLPLEVLMPTMVHPPTDFWVIPPLVCKCCGDIMLVETTLGSSPTWRCQDATCPMCGHYVTYDEVQMAL